MTQTTRLPECSAPSPRRLYVAFELGSTQRTPRCDCSSLMPDARCAMPAARCPLPDALAPSTLGPGPVLGPEP